MFQKMYAIKVVWFHKKHNSIEIFNAMKLYLSIQGTQINIQSCDHSYNQIEPNKEKIEIKYHWSWGHNSLLCEN
jgi:hypothetical protein